MSCLFFTAKRKRKRAHRLDDEDFNLIEENLGLKIKKKKYERIKTMSSDEDEGEGEADAREVIQDQLFQSNDFEEEVCF